MYNYKPLARLKVGQHFMFKQGSTINRVIHKQRNEIIYYNLLTGKVRKVKGFVDVFYTAEDNELCRVCKLTYVKMLDGMFDKYVDDKIEELKMPF